MGERELTLGMDAERADLRAARQGDSEAALRVFERHRRMIRAVVLCYCRPHEVDDVLQDVFLLAMRGFEGQREDGGVGPWFAGIARRAAMSTRRRIARRWGVLMRLAERTRVTGGSGEGPGAGKLDAAEVLEAIQRLPEEYRGVLVMRLVEQFTGPQIAAWTGRSHAAVRVALHRGMTLLRRELGWSEEQ